MTAKRKPDLPEERANLIVPIPGGGTCVMRPLATARQYIALKKGLPHEIMQMTADAMVAYPGDPLDLSPVDLLTLASNWVASREETAVPPPTA